MYIPRHFEIADSPEIFAFIEANAFGQLISTLEGRLFSTHMPFLLGANHNLLLGHLARANPQWRDIEGQEVLITLQGPHDYISPPGITHRVCQHGIIRQFIFMVNARYLKTIQNLNRLSTN